MIFSLPYLLGQIPTSLRDPRGFALQLIALDMPRSARWQLLFVSAVIGVALTTLNVYRASQSGTSATDPLQMSIEDMILNRPFIHVLLQFSLLVITVFLIYWVGRMARGIGDLPPAILLVAWVEFVLAAIRGVQAVVFFVSPPLAVMVGVFGLGIMFWLLSNFIAELLGFASPFWVLLGILATAIGVMVGVIFLLVLIGLTSGATDV